VGGSAIDGNPRKNGVEPMNVMKRLSSLFVRTLASASGPVRPTVRRAPACESLEGRQLLNASWAPTQGLASYRGTGGSDPLSYAHVRAFDLKGATHGAHALDHQGGANHQFAPMSAQLQADFQTLRTDQKTLRSEIPANLTATVKADQAVIQKAFSSLTSTQRKALFAGDGQSGSSTSDPTANLAANLTAAGVSPSQVGTIVTDLQSLKNALTTTDPTLQAKIAADQAAIVKDGGPSVSIKGMGTPGMF
jgi:hypothetical protein